MHYKSVLAYLKSTRKLILTYKQSLLYMLVGVTVFVGIFLIRSLVVELHTPNYGFHGTHYDFLAFYAAGKSVLNHHVQETYNAAKILALQRTIIPHPVGAAGYMPFLNPPFVTVFLSPLALFSINTARLVWLGLSLIIAITIIYRLMHPLSRQQRIFATLLILLTFPFYQTFIEGQLSILILLGGGMSILYFRQKRHLLSGASLLPLWVIPQFGVFVAIGLLMKRQWQMLKGWVLSSTITVLITLPITGVKIYVDYIRLLARTTSDHFVNMNTSALLTWRGSLNTTMGLNGFFAQLIGQNHTKLVNGLYTVSSLALIAGLFWYIHRLGSTWKTKQEAMLFITSLLVACVIDPHLYAQDVIVICFLLPALFALYRHHELKIVIIFAAVSDLVLLDQYSRLHFFTLLATAVAIYYAAQATKRLPATK